MGLRYSGNVVFGEGRNIALAGIGLQMAERELVATVNGIAAKAGAAEGAALLELYKGLMRVAAAEGANTLRLVANQVGNGELAKRLLQSGFSLSSQQIVRGVPTMTLVRTFGVR
jgi:hypothetical protein